MVAVFDSGHRPSSRSVLPPSLCSVGAPRIAYNSRLTHVRLGRRPRSRFFATKKIVPRFDSRRKARRCFPASLHSFHSVGAPRIELGLSAPKADVLPVYYAPRREREYHARMYSFRGARAKARLTPRSEFSLLSFTPENSIFLKFLLSNPRSSTVLYNFSKNFATLHI